MSPKVILLTGTCGAGKTAVAAELNDLLAELAIPNAALDLDSLTWQWPPDSKWNDDLMFESLAALWPGLERRGVEHLVLARVLEKRADLGRYEAAIGRAEISVCRLRAPAALRAARLRDRMAPGPSLEWHLSRSVELEKVLDEVGSCDFEVDNGDRPIRQVAAEVLQRAGWSETSTRIDR